MLEKRREWVKRNKSWISVFYISTTVFMLVFSKRAVMLDITLDMALCTTEEPAKKDFILDCCLRSCVYATTDCIDL